MGIYKAIASPSDARQITFTCSIDLIIEAPGPLNDIFGNAEEIRVLPGRGEAVQKKLGIIKLLLDVICSSFFNVFKSFTDKTLYLVFFLKLNCCLE